MSPVIAFLAVSARSRSPSSAEFDCRTFERPINDRSLCAMNGHCEKLIRETAVSYLRRISAID
jgi:hypothetical protein